MFLQALSCKVPEYSFTQDECWDIFEQSRAAETVTDRSKGILEKVLKGDSGIDKRHFAVNDIESLFDRDAERLNHDFEAHAPELAASALTEALEKAGRKASELDALFVCTCSGYLCPGLSSYVSELLGIKQDAYLQDIVGLGCGAAIPTLRSAHNLIKADPTSTVAVIAVEICSAAFYLDNNPGVLISLCLFGDGASASIWNGRPGPSQLKATGFDTLHLPEDRELLRFINRGGKLRNKLHKTVPEKASNAVMELFERQNLSSDQYIISHAGGRDVLEAINRKLKQHPLTEATNVLRNFGNMSSPSVLFALDDFFEGDGKDESLWLTSFGAGFAAHSMQLEKT
ncbi:type III polyketide synthase [Rubellicoccus peritrichatus]|uniref:3-oxoacyl-[acyl-carrier-protein] synthase III C-terminal domain-containing protein n=1 Tax=Rubellicoccus peritrichatus TaxID=3080537 RepID=A0AAQ3L8W6_9BACT|nr:3-oxoacyl-[acyl-carrier-protein] synthase III C-terminal domain-containing protein [Puniceicoccus sp. CR14]WOO39445.1 3-oxoacyl-[acyl-carrier-protein] synthase III C-terminal domain-containing protein [Puniceicoccus sp. CR14]